MANLSIFMWYLPSSVIIRRKGGLSTGKRRLQVQGSPAQSLHVRTAQVRLTQVHRPRLRFGGKSFPKRKS